MKAILSLIISSALVVSGHSQTRNVLVGTNNTVVQPTNFWSADASNARTGLGLGSAATNDASAFQPSSLSLSNLASSNGGSLTNLQAANIVGTISSSNIPSVSFTNLAGTLTIAQGGTSATNAANARQNLGSTTVGDALFIATNAASARTTLGATTVGGSVFTAIDAATARTALSLGTASTNPASAFQPSSTVLSNLANSNGASLTNISVSNVVGALSTNGNGFALTNLNASNITGLISASNIPSVTASNLSGTLAIASGGTGATNAGGARTNLGLGATNIVQLEGVVANAIYSGTNTTNDIVLDAQNWIIYAQANQVFYWDTNLVNFNVPVQFNNTTNAATTRTNLGLGATWLTNTNVTNFRTAIGLGATNNVVFNSLQLGAGTNTALFISDEQTILGDGVLYFEAGQIILKTPLEFNNTTNATTTRTNLGLGWPALTNSNAGTGLVSVNTNGVVVSPTNFWQVAPIQTIVQNLAPITNSTNAATNARNLYVYSLATNITGVTNTVTLPTNTSTFGGDNATIIHQGPTSSVTVVRQAGDTNDLISINRFDESVKFIYENNAWAPYHNISFQEPIYFSGTNVSNNVAISRTNLGLGQASSVRFGEGTEANVGVGVGSTNVGLTSGGATIQGRLGLIEGGNIVAVLDGDSSPFFGLYRPITFQGTNATSNAATTRTNLFGHGGLSTNIDIKLNNNDGMRLYFTNGILTNAVTPIP